MPHGKWSTWQFIKKNSALSQRVEINLAHIKVHDSMIIIILKTIRLFDAQTIDTKAECGSGL